ncbi:MAG: hypothetical protein IMF12_02020, partial [Proteobacteria bacterium]|nr:hypothetical protein [Pseudomonadota bacterium]
AGNVTVRAKEMTLLDATQIDVSVLGDGDASDSIIDIKVENALTIAGQHPTNTMIISGIASFSESQKPGSSGNSGSLNIEAGKISLLNAGGILSGTTGSGNAGDINLTAKEELIMSGTVQVVDDPFEDSVIALLPWASGIMAASTPIYVEGSSQGSSGNIEVEARKIIIRNGAQIANFSSSKDSGGTIKITAEEIITEGQDLVKWDSPDGPQELLFKSGINSSSLSSESWAGNAGNITIIADKITVKDNAEITTQTANAAGGDINITVPELLYVKGGTISTSANGGEGDGGNINIDNPIFIALNNGQIKAQADAGHGGNINLKTENLIQSTDSLISASSRLGLDGNIKIESPDLDMEGFLVVLSDDVVEASSLIQKPCRMRGSSFTVQKINGSPQTPYDYQPSQYLPETDNTQTTTTSKNVNKKIASSSGNCSL